MSAKQFQLVLAVLYLSLFSVHALTADTFSMTSSDGTKVRIFDEPCKVSTGWLKLKKATVFWRGKHYEACWALVAGAVVVFDSAGDASPIPASAFTKEQGA